ncbi:TPA: TIGR00725 family protein [bacterium]|nr:TIGR00725 family protein [bacterium]
MRIGVIGNNTASLQTRRLAYEVGKEIAKGGGILICGGLGGVMEAACQGTRDAGGMTVGILPGSSSKEANPYVSIPIVTGFSHGRNIIVVRSSEAIIAIEGSYGTLSEIAFALILDIPVIGLNTWLPHREGHESPPLIAAKDPEEAVRLAIDSISSQKKSLE